MGQALVDYSPSTVTPVSTRTNRAGRPIPVARRGDRTCDRVLRADGSE